MKRAKRTLAIHLADNGGPPTEFRLFTTTPAWNETTKGSFLFDEEAARLVMSAYAEWGVDLAIDLEHQMLDGAGADPTARDARGWFKLELRPDGLYAVDVRWTPDGAQRLSEKRQRYVSPAFTVDPETSRVTSIINVALVAMPATHNTPALVAANVTRLGMLSPEMIKKALEAIKNGDADAAMSLLEEAIAAAASGGEAPAEEAPIEEPAAEMAAAPAAEEDKPEEAVAAASRLMRLTGKSSIVDAVAQVEIFRASHLELETERQALATERKTLEAAERRKLCAELVTLAGRAPAEVWADDSATAPKGYLAAMPLADLRAMHADAVKSSAKAPRIAAPKGAPVAAGAKEFSTPDGVVTLSASELKACAEAGAKVEDYAANKAARKARS